MTLDEKERRSEGDGMSAPAVLDPELCPKHSDEVHCEHWWDCGPCCACGAQFTGCDCDCCEPGAPCKPLKT